MLEHTDKLLFDAYPSLVALEGALKMTEITDTHAKGFAAGELKHGPLALVTEKTPVFALLTEGSNLEKTLGNVKEVEAREAPVVAVTDAPDAVGRYAEHVLEMASHPQLTPVLATVQQGWHTADILFHMWGFECQRRAALTGLEYGE